MRYQGSLSDYRSDINAMMLRVKEFSSELSNDDIIKTVNAALDWVADKADQEISLHDLAKGIGDPTGGSMTFFRIGPLMGGKPMLEAVMKVEDAAGNLHLLADVYKASQGETYVVPGTAEVLATSREGLEGKTYVYFKVADFSVDYTPSL